MLSGTQEPLSDTQDQKAIHAISIAYTTISIRFCCFVLKGDEEATQRLTLHLLPHSISQRVKSFENDRNVRPQLSGLEAVGTTCLRSRQIPTLLCSNFIPGCQEIQSGVEGKSLAIFESPRSQTPQLASQPRCYKPAVRHFATGGHTYIMNSCADVAQG